MNVRAPATKTDVWLRIDVRGADECWPFTGSIDKQGYGYFTYGSRKDGTRRVTTAHRVAYETRFGDVSPELVLDHCCHNEDLDCPGGDTCLHRRCCNPSHVELVTPSVNGRSGRSSVFNLHKTHCPKGHPYDQVNTYRQPNGGRRCRQCHRQESRGRVAS